MQILGVSVFSFVLSMIFIFYGLNNMGSYFFGFSLILLLSSLIYSLRELQISTKALDLELSKMELGRLTKF